MTLRRPLSRPRVVLGAAIVAAVLGGGCKEDPPPGKLFAEDGSYELHTYDLDGMGYQLVVEPGNTSRDQAFLMKLDASAKVAQMAMCAENETDTPETSLCRLSSPTESFWFCQCFAYAFVEAQMQWRQFAPGDVPPKVEFTGDATAPVADDTATGGSGGGSGDIDPAADTIIELVIVPMVVGEYEFAPLPVGVFGSDGLAARYTFQQRAPSIFDQVFEDPEGRIGCQPCVP